MFYIYRSSSYTCYPRAVLLSADTLPVVCAVRGGVRRAGRRPRAAPCRRARAQHGTVRLLGCAQSGAGDRGRGAPAWASVRTSWRT